MFLFLAFVSSKEWGDGAISNVINTRARIFKLLRSPRIDSEDSIPPTYPTGGRHDYPICRTSPPVWRNRFLSSLNFYKFGLGVFLSLFLTLHPDAVFIQNAGFHIKAILWLYSLDEDFWWSIYSYIWSSSMPSYWPRKWPLCRILEQKMIYLYCRNKEIDLIWFDLSLLMTFCWPRKWLLCRILEQKMI